MALLKIIGRILFDPNTIKSKDQKETPIVENDSIGKEERRCIIEQIFRT